MGVSEPPMVSSDVLQKLIAFGISIMIVVSFFSSLSGQILLSQESLKGDSLANAMSTVSMHNMTEISITWDKSRFISATSEGVLIMKYLSGSASISPYPAVFDFAGSVKDGNFKYLEGLKVSNFTFINDVGDRGAFLQ